MFRVLFLLCLAAASVPASAAPAKRPITHEDLWLMKRVGAPVVSPDGKWAVFSVNQPSYDPKEQTSDLWMVATDGQSPPRKLTQTKTPEANVQWSPDGRRIAFTAKRDGDEVSQVYVLDLASGGDAERITSLSTGAQSPVWSPDGRRILFVSEVYPGTADDDANKKAEKARKDRKYNARVYEGFPVKYWDRWLGEKRPHLFVQDVKAGAPARDLLAKTHLAELPGFAGRNIDSGEDLPAAWAPDGQSIVFVATTARDHAAYADVPTQLFELSANGGEPKALTNETNGYGELQFSPDGKTLVAQMEVGGDGKTYHHGRLVAFPWPFDGAKKRGLTAALDLSVGRFVISPDSASVYFLAEAGDRTNLFSVPTAGGEIRAFAGPADGCLAGLDAGASVLVATHDSASEPAEIVRIAPDGSCQRLTHFNDEAIAKLDLPPIERFETKNARGDTIHNLLVRPAGIDPAKKYPLFVVMHGGPSPQFKDAWGLRWNYHLLAAPGYVLVLTNYSGSSGYSEAFGQAIQTDPLKGPADEINAAADAAIARYAFIDGTRQAAGGASYGGHLANWMEATTTRYKCIIAHAGLVNLETQWSTSDSVYHRELNNGGPVWAQGAIWREQNPVRLVDNHFKGTGWVTPILVTVGENDFRVPINNSLENWTYLQRLQVPSKLIVFPEENHWITKGEDSRFWFAEVHAWLARWLK